MDAVKTCARCRESKPISEFYKRAASSDGLQKACKPCDRKASKKYKAEHAAEISEYNKRYMAEWRVENADRKRESDRQYYAENSGRLKEYQKQHRQENLDMIRAREADYRKNNPGKVAESSHRRRARMRKAHTEKGVNRESLRQRDGDYCFYCERKMSFDKPPKDVRVGEYATVEHLQPISQDGAHAFFNCVLACWDCNSERGTRDWIAFKAIHMRRFFDEDTLPVDQPVRIK